VTGSIGVVTNPRRRRSRPGGAQALAYVLGERGELVVPGDLEALAHHARRFRDRGIATLCVDGGDGTLHRVLTAMARVYDGAPLPAVAILRSGTMNIVADSVGATLERAEALGAVVEAQATGADVPTTRRHLLRVDTGEGEPSFGFIVGNGVVARFLDEWEADPAPSPLTAGVLLARAAGSVLVDGALARRLTRPYDGHVTLDGGIVAGTRWTAVAVATIEQMGLGFRVFPRVASEPGRLQLVAIGSTPRDLARELPGLYAGRGVHRPGNTSATGTEATFTAQTPFPYTIDGDLYEARRLRITVGPEVTFLVPVRAA
jgi:diacylglycerol kinase family enzyme